MSDITKCVVCRNTLHHKTVVCVNGHHICYDCKRTQEVCPTCRKAFSNVLQSTLVRQMLEVMPHPCRFTPCEVVVKSGDDHESYCDHRPTNCRAPACKWEGPCRELAKHVRGQHRLDSSFGGWPLISETQFDSSEDYSGVFLTQYDKLLIWKEISYSENEETRFKFTPVLTCKLHFEHVKVQLSFNSNSSKSVFEKKLRIDRSSPSPEYIYVSYSMLLDFVMKEDFKLTISIFP